MDVSRWLLACLCACVFACAAVELVCEPPGCDGSKVSTRTGEREFTVEGHSIEYVFKDRRNNGSYDQLYIYCNGWEALDSPAMPYFASDFHAARLELFNCPLPSRHSSLAAALAALNVTLAPVENEVNFRISELQGGQLTPQHFVGLEIVTHLAINNKYGFDPRQRPTPTQGFAAGLQSLRTLHLDGIRLGPDEIYHLPQSLTMLWLCHDSVNSLPKKLPEAMSEILHASPGLRFLLLDLGTSTPEIDSNENKPKLYATSALKKIILNDWKEQSLAPLDYCDVLETFELNSAEVEELPERWVAACPHLEELTIFSAHQLKSLPAKLLDGATALKRLSIRLTKLQVLPAGFLEGAPNLLELDLSDNWLRRLSSASFVGPPLQSLSLAGNRMSTILMRELSGLTTLEDLNLNGNNVYLCSENDYSQFVNLTKLKSLSATETMVTYVCRDWRENLTQLKVLDLRNTDIAELKGPDFIYTRDATVEDPKVLFSTTVHMAEFTEEDYKTALASPSGAELVFSDTYSFNALFKDIRCNCETAWLRRAVARDAVQVAGLKCRNQKPFKDMTAEEMCPEPTTETAS